MSSKEDLLDWNDGVKSYDAGEYEKAVTFFDKITSSVGARIHFNLGMCYGAMGSAQDAIQCFTNAVRADKFLAVAYFMRGFFQIQLRGYGKALQDYDNAVNYMRGNALIDYKQLGMDFKLYYAEVMYNRGMVQHLMGRTEQAAQDLVMASQAKMERDHEIIDQVLASRRFEGPFTCPKNALYRPPEQKLKNAQKVDYIKRDGARLVAATDSQDNYIGFKDAQIRKEVIGGQQSSRGGVRGNFDDPYDPGNRGASMGSRRDYDDYDDGAPMAPVSRGGPPMGYDNPNVVPRAGPGGYSSRPAPAPPQSRGSDDRYGYDAAPPSRGGFDAAPPSRGGFDAAPPSRGGFDAAPPSRGGFDAAPPSRGGFDAAPPSRGGFGAPGPSSPGYGGPQRSGSGSGPSVGGAKIKVKCHYKDTRIVNVESDISIGEFIRRVQDKFDGMQLLIKYKDEDGDLVMMVDQEDLYMAMQSPDVAQGKLDIWLYD